MKLEQANLPKTMLRWNLYGAGFENLGKEEKPEVVAVPSYGEEELLVRQDACGLSLNASIPRVGL